MTHRCHAQGCTAVVPPRMLMCQKHWAAVPREMQREVWRTYQPAQCDNKRPSHAWLVAARNAINTVARAEGRIK